MDHDHGQDHGASASKTCPMIMTFHAGHCERILWSGWLAYSITEFVFSAIGIFFIAFGYEALKFVREYHIRRVCRNEHKRIAALVKGNSSNEGSCSNTPLENGAKSCRELIFGPTHLIQTGLNLIQVMVSYMLMLIIMTYNYWLCLAAILGLGVGYFCFGWIKQQVYENECCQ